MEQSIHEILGKAKGKEEENHSAVRKHRSQSAEGNRKHHSESVDPPPALVRVARPRVPACPVCEVWSFFEEVKRSRRRKQPNRLTEGQTSQQFDNAIDVHFEFQKATDLREGRLPLKPPILQVPRAFRPREFSFAALSIRRPMRCR
jgi:hypothetical protein